MRENTFLGLIIYSLAKIKRENSAVSSLLIWVTLASCKERMSVVCCTVTVLRAAEEWLGLPVGGSEKPQSA